MVSRKNIKYKWQQEAKRVPHYGIRKLSIGVASVLLSTVFYMQNGTAHADVNPTVNVGNDTVNVVNKDVGNSGSTGAVSMSTGTGSTSSVVSAGNTTNLMGVRQTSESPDEGATKQAGHTAWAASEPGSVVSASQVNAGTDKTNVISSLSSVPNQQTSAIGGSLGNEQLSDNLALSVNQKLNANFSSLLASKVALTGVSNNAVNGGFDQSKWGTLDVSKWTGHENNGIYELTDYTGNLEHIIVPNSADFAKAGRNVGQVGISADTTHSWFLKGSPKSIAFSKTDGQMVKAVGSDWTGAFTGAFDRSGEHIPIESALTLFDGSNLDILNITNMLDMFAFNQISDLTSLANWKTDNVTDMHGMFGNNQISDLAPLANWETDNVTDMGATFMMNQISDLSPLANWKTNNVTDMSYMFNGDQIVYADFTKWNFGKVNSLDYFIYQWTPAIIIVKNADQTLLSNSQVISTEQNQLHFGADTIDMPTVYVASDKADARQKILADIKTKLADYQKSHAGVDIKPVKPLDELTELVDLANAKFTVKHVLSELDTNDAFALDPVNGLHEHKNVNDNGGYDADFWGTLDVSKFTTVKNGDDLEITGYNGDASKVIIPNIDDFWANKLDQGAKQVTISSSVMHDLAKKATRIGLSKTDNQKVVASDAIWQDAFGGMTNDPQTGDNADGGMWVYNPNLTAMDLHNLDTTNITNIDSMFNGGRNLTVVGDLSQWNVANVVSMRDMFQMASSLINIGDLDNWDTSKVTDMTSMFAKATSLTNIGDLSKWDTGNVTNMHNMFANATNLTNIGNLDNWNTSKVIDMSWMFGTDPGKQSHLTNIGDLSKWQTGNVTNMSYMFYNTTNLTNIGNLDNWNISKVTDMSYMFYNATHLTNIGNLSKWNTSKVTDMTAMFYNVINLTNIGNLSNWDTSKVTDMNSMFYNATSLINIGDLSKWNTSKVTDMSWMFGGTTNLTNIGNLDNWDTSNVTNMNCMFYNATNLTNIGNLSKWQTGNVTNMSYMFMSANALRHLNISNWDLTNLANKDSMKHMFANDIDLTVIANDLKLPTWYQNEINDAYYFWSNHMAVITSVPELIRATGDIDNLKIDDKDASRSIFYDSKGSSDAIQVLKDANQAYIKHYQNEHPGYTLNLAADVDQTDPIALANAKFISVPREVQFTIAYYDLTGKLVDSTTSTHKVGDIVSISPVAPNNYVLVSGQAKTDYLMRSGLNEVDFLVEPKLTTTTETKTVTRTIKVWTPDGQTKNVAQTVTFVRNGYLNQVTKETTYSSWSFNGQYQFSDYQPKPMDGYTVDVVPAVSVTPDSSYTAAEVAYHPIPVAYEIDYQLADGMLIAKAQNVATNDGMLHLTAPQGYRLLTTVTDVHVSHSSQKLAVLVAPAEQTYTANDDLPSAVKEPLAKTVTRTVKITMPNGHVRTVKQSVKFERTATVKADGTVSYSNWQAIGRAQFNKVFVPKRFGYHLTGQADQVAVTADMTDSVIEIKYVKN